MFILTNVSVQNDLAKVFDTTDMTEDIVSLTTLASNIRSRKLKVYGIASLKRPPRPTDVVVASLGIIICMEDAKKALAGFYIEKGYPKGQAYQLVGLNA